MTDDQDTSRRHAPRNPLARALSGQFTAATVTEVGMVTPTMRRVRLVLDEPFTRSYTPGQHVRVQINDPLSLSGILHPGETLRTYTIWEYTTATRSLELRVHLFEGDGIGLRWARAVAPGDPVVVWGPLGEFVTREAPYHVFVGEETATAAFGPMLRALASDERVYGVVESESPEDEPPLPGPHHPRRVHRHGAPATSSATLLAAVADLALPPTPGVAYVAGEARTCQLVRGHLVRELGWPRRAVTVKPFWAPGKRGLH